jgi:SNF2 family DNA or RNA helicase
MHLCLFIRIKTIFTSTQTLRLGKTLQIIALVAEDYNKGPTLLVCPLSLIGNWQGQIREHVVEGALKVHVHHG